MVDDVALKPVGQRLCSRAYGQREGFKEKRHSLETLLSSSLLGTVGVASEYECARFYSVRAACETLCGCRTMELALTYLSRAVQAPASDTETSGALKSN